MKGTVIQQMPNNSYSLGIRELLIINSKKNWNRSTKLRAREKFEGPMRVITGHDCLAAHKRWISIFPPSLCVLCCEKDSVLSHEYLLKCVEQWLWTRFNNIVLEREKVNNNSSKVRTINIKNCQLSEFVIEMTMHNC